MRERGDSTPDGGSRSGEVLSASGECEFNESQEARRGIEEKRR